MIPQKKEYIEAHQLQVDQTLEKFKDIDEINRRKIEATKSACKILADAGVYHFTFPVFKINKTEELGFQFNSFASFVRFDDDENQIQDQKNEFDKNTDLILYSIYTTFTESDSAGKIFSTEAQFKFFNKVMNSVYRTVNQHLKVENDNSES